MRKTILSLQILSLNPNLNEEIYAYLINQSFLSFENPEQNDGYLSDRININQLSIANISLGFIFKPDLTFKILNVKSKIGNIEILNFDKFIRLIAIIFNITFPDYNPLLGKCIILGICGILTDKSCLEYLDSNKDRKSFLLRIFLNFIIKHKKEKNLILNKLMKKELKCNFVDDDEDEEEEEEDEEEIDTEFNEKVEQVLSGNDNIINSDEFKYYTQVMKSIRENDGDIYNNLINEACSGNSNFIEDLFKVRNIKIKYNDKELTVPRKTVRIIRNYNQNKN